MNSSSAQAAAISELMQRLVASEGFRPRLLALDQTVRFELTAPSLTLTARFLRGRPFAVWEASKPADAVVRGEVEAMSRLLLGELNPFLAMAEGSLEFRGRSERVLAAIPQLIEMVTPLYAGLLAGQVDSPAEAFDLPRSGQR